MFLTMALSVSMLAGCAGKSQTTDSNAEENQQETEQQTEDTANDDAAGLQISETMRHHVKGLNKASRNSQDGISMLQTADAALQETQDVLDRMVELTTQAMTSTQTRIAGLFRMSWIS